MTISKPERLIIANQFKILEILDPTNKKEYELNREIVERGFSFDYDEVLKYVFDELSLRECERVLDILAMYTDLYQAVQEHHLPKITFPGFDGNNEPGCLSYARFYIEKLGRFADIPKISQSNDLNSHSMTEDIYNRMLDAWRESKDLNNLTPEDVKRILDARNYK
jgi:uncharacterized protein